MSTMEIVGIGVKSLIHRRKRTALTVAGTVIGIAAIVLMVSVGKGFQSSVNQLIGQFGGDTITIMPGTGNLYASMLAPTFFTDDDVRAIEHVAGVTYVAGIASKTLPVTYNGKTVSLTVYGYPADAITKIYGKLTKTYIESGRPPHKGDQYVVMLGNRVAHKIFGKDIVPGKSIEIAGKRFRVIAVFRKFGDEADDTRVNIPLTAFKEITGESKPKYVTITAKVADRSRIKDIAERIKRVLKARRGREDFQVLTPEDLAKTINDILGIITAIVTGIAAIALVVGAVGIMNTMYMSVTERTREIGVMKAVGATKGQIMGIFLAEAGLLGLIGGLIGEGIAVALALAAQWGVRTYGGITYYSAYLGPDLLIGAAVFSLVIGIVAGMLPAKRAADLDPVVALRYE